MKDKELNSRAKSEHPREGPLQLEVRIAELWKRIDRDASGYITKQELDCEAFHEVIRAAVHPDRAATGGALPARAELNMHMAIHFCLRKADFNADGKLSFDEFRCLLTCLSGEETHSADLAFALFDLDCNGKINKKEFRELCRFYLGRTPTVREVQEEWLRLADVGQAEATKKQYILWLQTTPTAAFYEFAPPWERSRDALRDLSRKRPPRDVAMTKPPWNKRLYVGPNPGHMNDFLSQGQREYFSQAQSMPELRNFYEGFSGTDTFKKHLRALDAPAEPVATSALFPRVLSSEGGTPLMLPGRHGPDGTMLDHSTGRPAIWEDHFVAPLRLRFRDRPSDYPLAPRATFGELTGSFVSTQSTSRGTRRTFGRTAGTERCSRDPDRFLPISAARSTTLEAIPW